MILNGRETALPAPELSQSLLDAKISVPQTRPGGVTRADLVNSARSSGCRLVAVTAPAGYGKSTLLAQWAHAEHRRVAWVSLDRFDDDPAMLAVSLASAFCRAGLGSADLVAEMGGPGVSVLSRAAPRLASAFRASAVPFVLMLDDLHELQSPACHDVLGVVVLAIPEGSQLAVASRSEQPHLPRLRVSGEVLEFGADDLALDATGARQIFANAQVGLTAEQAADVIERTEGWPAGLCLSALIAKESHGQPEAVTGDHRYVADYLYREALIQQPEDMQRFLRRTAVVDQLCGPLCDALLGSSTAARHLRQLEACCLFLVPLDRRREWYRYHSLFREFLLGELRRAEPDVIMTLHQRAADWYETNRSPTLALEHLLQTTCWDRSARLATALALPTFNAGQLLTFQRWLRTIGDANIERHPPLAVQRCYAAGMAGDTTEAERWAAFVDAASFDLPPLDGSGSFDSGRAMLRATMCPSGPQPMMADATFAVTQEPAWSPFRGNALWTLGEANLLAGHIDQACRLLGEASAAAAATGNADTAVLCESELAWLAMDRGDWQEAAGRLEYALATIDQFQMYDYITCLQAFAGAARLSVHRSDTGEAHRHLAQAMRARLPATYVAPFVAVRLRLQLAKANLALAELATARQLLREIDDILIRRPALGNLADPGRGAPPPPRVQRLFRSERQAATHPSRATAASLPADTPHGRPDRGAAVPLQSHGQDPGEIDLPQAGCLVAQRRGPKSSGDRLARLVDETRVPPRYAYTHILAMRTSPSRPHDRGEETCSGPGRNGVPADEGTVWTRRSDSRTSSASWRSSTKGSLRTRPGSAWACPVPGSWIARPRPWYRSGRW